MAGMNSQDQMEPGLRHSDKFNKLRNQHMPGERLYQSTTFRSTVMMRHDAACSVQLGQHASDSAGNAH